jgi:putative ABC transport system ATP-binding protein
MADDHSQPSVRAALRWVAVLLRPERSFITLVLVYGVAISLLSLATPISVQMLINTVANTALVTPLLTLAAVLLALLLLASTLGAFRVHLMELFSRRFYSRLVAQITLRTIHARNPFFQDQRLDDLFNRYFDVMTVQKGIPSLLIGGFTVVLQAGAGLTLTAFYHPFFLAFNLLVLAIALGILSIWGRRAVRTGIAVSHAKYRTARWLEGLGNSNGFFKASRRIGHAVERSEAATAEYIEAKKRHYRNTFAQTLAFYLLYAFASAGLLALGGWLVIRGQLSIGQLVAAELILSAAFYGLSQLGTYLEVGYDLIAALDEIGLLVQVPQETTAGERAGRLPPGDLQFRAVRLEGVGVAATLDLSIPQGSQLAATAETHEVARLFTTCLKRLAEPGAGLVTIGGVDIDAIEANQLRSEVVVLDRTCIVETTIREYLRLACATPEDSGRVLDVLQVVGLQGRIERLHDGLDTGLSPTGWPLSYAETMQLKLAGALLARPRILVLSLLYDMIEEATMNRVLAALRGSDMTVICFTHRPEHLQVRGHLWLGISQQVICGREQLLEFRELARVEEVRGNA